MKENANVKTLMFNSVQHHAMFPSSTDKRKLDTRAHKHTQNKLTAIQNNSDTATALDQRLPASRGKDIKHTQLTPSDVHCHMFKHTKRNRTFSRRQLRYVYLSFPRYMDWRPQFVVTEEEQPQWQCACIVHNEVICEGRSHCNKNVLGISHVYSTKINKEEKL